MRLVIDLQACQTDSRDRGIGRYAINLADAIASELRDDDELIIAIDMADVDRARDLRNVLHRRHLRAKVVAYGYPTTSHTDASPAARRMAGQLRSHFFASLRPDVMLVCSLFEYGTCFSAELDWASLGDVPTAVIGYDAIPLLFPDRYLPAGAFVTGWYKSRLDDLRAFDLILSISDATRHDLVNLAGIAEERIVVIGAGFDERLVCFADAADCKRRLQELQILRPFVLMVGNGDWRKNTIGALQAFASLPEALRETHDLVLTQAGEDVLQALEHKYAYLGQHVHILGRIDDATLAVLYRECRVLYFPSHYEGFGLPVLEAMALNVPVLASNAGALPEVIHDQRALFLSTAPEGGVGLLIRVLSDEKFREEIRLGAREHVLRYTWESAACKAVGALRALAGKRQKERWTPAAAAPVWPREQDVDLMATAYVEAGEAGDWALENGLRAIMRGDKRRVLVDISEIVRLDARTGIQRVTRNFFVGLASLAREKGSFEVEPFCWTESGIRYAREFARTHLDTPFTGVDELVRIQPSDLVCMLDSSWWSPERFDNLHAPAHLAGGEVVWMVYDLVPIRFPQTCDPGMPPAFKAWLEHAARGADGFICISEATRHDLEEFLDAALDSRMTRPWTRSVHLGCDFDAGRKAVSAAGVALRDAIGPVPYFVTLGTLEPRKDHGTILDAFERLWGQDSRVALVVIGKQGWNVEALAERINRHAELGRRLFWMLEANDSDVRTVLQGAKALIQASIAEGFGLPLIEAANLGVPLLVSDIPVFHEIAEDSAKYFPVGDAVALADAVADVILSAGVTMPPKLRCRSWKEASVDLAKALGV